MIKLHFFLASQCTKKLFLAGALLDIAVSLFATRTTSRNFSNLEEPLEFVVKKNGQIRPSFFVTSAGSAEKRNGGGSGSPIELWGDYNIKNIVDLGCWDFIFGKIIYDDLDLLYTGYDT